jgi:hypothetical protein
MAAGHSTALNELSHLCPVNRKQSKGRRKLKKAQGKSCSITDRRTSTKDRARSIIIGARFCYPARKTWQPLHIASQPPFILQCGHEQEKMLN